MGSLRHVLLFGLLLGCTQDNPRYCDERRLCPEGQVCDIAARQCIEGMGGTA